MNKGQILNEIKKLLHPRYLTIRRKIVGMDGQVVKTTVSSTRI